MKTVETVAAHYLQYDEEGSISSNNPGFDPQIYSRMKYGDREASQLLAGQLADTLLNSQPHLTDTKTPPEFLVTYKAVPPACYYLSRYCLDTLNEVRNEAGLEPGRLIHVYKSKVAATNYAIATAEERQRELNSIGFSLEGRQLANTSAVVLDDIRITGAAEKKMIELIQPERPKRLTLGYVAFFDPDQAAVSPHVENDLNASHISSAADLLPAIETDNFDLNIRTLKLILASAPPALEEFLSKCPDNLIQEMYRGSLGTGPDFTQQYHTGHTMLASMAHSRRGA